MCVCERVDGQAGLDREARVPCVLAAGGNKQTASNGHFFPHFFHSQVGGFF